MSNNGHLIIIINVMISNDKFFGRENIYFFLRPTDDTFEKKRKINSESGRIK